MQYSLATASNIKKEGLSYINDNLVGYMNTMASIDRDTYEATANTLTDSINKSSEVVKRRIKPDVDPAPFI